MTVAGLRTMSLSEVRSICASALPATDEASETPELGERDPGSVVLLGSTDLAISAVDYPARAAYATDPAHRQVPRRIHRTGQARTIRITLLYSGVQERRAQTSA